MSTVNRELTRDSLAGDKRYGTACSSGAEDAGKVQWSWLTENDGLELSFLLDYDCIVARPSLVEARWYLLGQKHTIAFLDIIAGNPRRA